MKACLLEKRIIGKMFIELIEALLAVLILRHICKINGFQLPQPLQTFKIISLNLVCLQINPLNLHAGSSSILFRFHIHRLVKKNSIRIQLAEQRVVFPIFLFDMFLLIHRIIRQGEHNTRHLQLFVNCKIVDKVGKTFICGSRNHRFFFHHFHHFHRIRNGSQRINLFSEHLEGVYFLFTTSTGANQHKQTNSDNQFLHFLFLEKINAKVSLFLVFSKIFGLIR